MKYSDACTVTVCSCADRLGMQCRNNAMLTVTCSLCQPECVPVLTSLCRTAWGGGDGDADGDGDGQISKIVV